MFKWTKQLISLCKLNRNFSQQSNSFRKLPVLTLYTKYPCQLCDIAKEEITPYSHQFQLEIVDISKQSNLKWWEKYKFDIPVFHFEGKFLMWHKADLKALEKALQDFQGACKEIK